MSFIYLVMERESFGPHVVKAFEDKLDAYYFCQQKPKLYYIKEVELVRENNRDE